MALKKVRKLALKEEYKVSFDTIFRYSKKVRKDYWGNYEYNILRTFSLVFRQQVKIKSVISSLGSTFVSISVSAYFDPVKNVKRETQSFSLSVDRTQANYAEVANVQNKLDIRWN